jgi:dienelactone hydrolase
VADGRRYTLGRAAALALAAVACHSPRQAPSAAASSAAPAAVRSAPSSASPPSASSAPVVEPQLPRVIDTRDFAVLPVAGFGDAVVSIPSDGSEPRRIVLALHGNFDRPEWQCEVWRRITRGAAWVLCPRGIPRRDVPKAMDRWEWGSLQSTKAELVAAIAALRARYGAHVAEGRVVFTGFSLGAILGARLLQDAELKVGAAVLVEGGYQGWTSAKAKALAPSFGQVLFACGQSACKNAYRYQLEPVFQRAGIQSALVADVKAGHTYDDPVAALVAAEWPAVIASIKYD